MHGLTTESGSHLKPSIPASLRTLTTPALLVRRDILQKNTESMVQQARELNVQLRPHLKTSKSVDVARLATETTFGGVCVSTLSEAQYFFAGGFRDLCCPNVIDPAKIGGFAALVRDGARITLCLADQAAAQLLAHQAREHDAHFEVLIEIESGARRTGVAAESAVLIDIARVVHAATHLRLAGVLTYAGQSYACASRAEIEEVAEIERSTAVSAAERLRAASLPCPVVSVGSTPTARFARRLDGVTEIRPGNYMFYDLMQLALGTANLSDLAVSVLTTVLACDRDTGRVVIDAGALALSKDVDDRRGSAGPGYGMVIDCAGSTNTGFHVAQLYQEHGVLAGSNPSFLSGLKVGDRLRVLPYHVCLTAAAFDSYHVLNAANEVINHWPKMRGNYN